MLMFPPFYQYSPAEAGGNIFYVGTGSNPFHAFFDRFRIFCSG